MRDSPGVFIVIIVSLSIVYWLIAYAILSLLGGRRIRRIGRRAAAISDLHAQGRTDEASAAIDDWSASIRPNDAVSWLRVAHVYSSLGDHERALRVIGSTRMPSSFLCRSVRRCGDELRHGELLALGRVDEARWFLHDVEARDPGAGWLTAGRLVQAKHDGDAERFTTLRQEADRAVESGSADLSLRVAVAQLALQEGRHDPAIARLEEVVAREKRLGRVPTHTFMALGYLRLASGDDRRAQDAFEEFVRRSPDQAAAVAVVTVTRANGLLLLGRVAEAAEAFERAAATSDDARLHLGLAMCRLRLGDLDATARSLDVAARADVDARAVDTVRAQLLADRGQAIEAVRLARSLIGDGPIESDPSAFYTLSYVMATLRLEGAEDLLRRYVAAQPTDPDLPALLARQADGGGTWAERLADVMPGRNGSADTEIEEL